MSGNIAGYIIVFARHKQDACVRARVCCQRGNRHRWNDVPRRAYRPHVSVCLTDDLTLHALAPRAFDWYADRKRKQTNNKTRPPRELKILIKVIGLSETDFNRSSRSTGYILYIVFAVRLFRSLTPRGGEIPRTEEYKCSPRRINIITVAYRSCVLFGDVLLLIYYPHVARCDLNNSALLQPWWNTVRRLHKMLKDNGFFKLFISFARKRKYSTIFRSLSL